MNIDWGGYPITLQRKRIKNLYLRIQRTGKIQISAPSGMTMDSIYAFLEKKRSWIDAHQQRLSTQTVEEPPSCAQKWLNRWHYEQMQQCLPPLFDKWQSVIGVRANKITIKSMKSRWGSCHPVKKYISINLRLIEKPLICLEYVIVHELVHILEASHNQRFYALMDQYMPGWKNTRKLLNECHA